MIEVPTDDKKKNRAFSHGVGTPYREEDIEPYYTHIRRGRPPAPEQLEDLKRALSSDWRHFPASENYGKPGERAWGSTECDAGGNRIQRIRRLEAYYTICRRGSGTDGGRWNQRSGVNRLAPHYSSFSVKSYNERAKEEAEKHGISITSVESWYKQPKFIEYWSDKVREHV